jgi:hypothetical protein
MPLDPRHCAFWLTTLLLFESSFLASSARADLQLSFITQYCNETIQTADPETDPRMLRDISNSLMTDAPAYLDDALYGQRRTNFVNLCPDLDGIGETSQEWIGQNRYNLSEEAVVIAAVREDVFDGAQDLLTALGWTLLEDTITMDYVAGVADIPLYAGLLPEGPVSLSGAGVAELNLLAPNPAPQSLYFFFQETSAFSPDTLDQLQTVPEPGTWALLSTALACCVPPWLIRRKRRIGG